jgi:hypothetical protein
LKGGPAVFNHRPVLNLRLKSWLYGLSVNDNACCCVDQYVNVSEHDKEGTWVISSGADKLVNETKRWAHINGVEFYQEEFSL